jgi:hypothetical protein
MEDLELHKFSPIVLEKKRKKGYSPIICFLGSRGSGKSTLVQDIVYYLREIKMGLCQSGTEEGNGFYSKIIHPLFIYNKFEPEALNDLLVHQKKKAKKLTAKGLELKHQTEEHVFVILDDLAYDKAMMKEESIREIFFNGRHYGITCIITFQFMMELKPEFRTNIDYVFVCKETKKDNIERLYKYFFGMFDKCADFKKVLNSCTNDYGCLVLDNTSKSERIEDQVFWYKAVLGREYRMGAPNWSKWDDLLKERNTGPEEEEEKTYVKKQKASTLRIIKKGPRNEL